MAMFENIGVFFKRFMQNDKKELLADNPTNTQSKDAAKERLHVVLMQDRANVSADFLELMKEEILEVIKKYIVIDESKIDVRLTNQENDDGSIGAPLLHANIPIVNIRNDVKGALENSSKQPILETPNVNNDIEKTQIIQAVKETVSESDMSESEYIEGQETIIIDEPIKAEDVNLEREETESEAAKSETEEAKEELPEDASLNIVIAVEEPDEEANKSENISSEENSENENKTESESTEIDSDEEDDDDVTFDDLLKAAEEEEREQQKQSEEVENNKEENKQEENNSDVLEEKTEKEVKEEKEKTEKKDVEKSKQKKPVKKAKKTVPKKKK